MCVLHDAGAVWASYTASEAVWAPPLPSEQVQYEFHIASWAALGAGASSAGAAPDRTLSGVLSRLNYLTALGVNVIQIMPVHESLKQCNSRDASGACIYTVGWGYDVQHLFAVEAFMGHGALDWVPGQAGPGLPGSSGVYVASYYLLQQLVAEAHRRGIAVLIDVCFNHVYRPINTLAGIDGWRPAAVAAVSSSTAGATVGSTRAPEATEPASWDFAGVYFFDQQPQASSPWGPRLNFNEPHTAQYLQDYLQMLVLEVRADGKCALLSRGCCHGQPFVAQWVAPPGSPCLTLLC